MVYDDTDETAQSQQSAPGLYRQESLEDAQASTIAASADQVTQIKVGKRLGVGSSCEVFSVQFLDG